MVNNRGISFFPRRTNVSKYHVPVFNGSHVDCWLKLTKHITTWIISTIDNPMDPHLSYRRLVPLWPSMIHGLARRPRCFGGSPLPSKPKGRCTKAMPRINDAGGSDWFVEPRCAAGSKSLGAWSATGSPGDPSCCTDVSRWVCNHVQWAEQLCTCTCSMYISIYYSTW